MKNFFTDGMDSYFYGVSNIYGRLCVWTSYFSSMYKV